MITVKNVVYEVPGAEVIALKSEGVICQSNVNIDSTDILNPMPDPINLSI